MPIILAPLNTKLRILKVNADGNTKMHLESMGIAQNGSITVLSSSGGAVVCIVKDGRVALDSNLSTKILVTEDK